VEPCPFCGSRSRRPHAERRLACCPDCLSLERHRALATQLTSELEPRACGRCLELGPRSARVFGGYLQDRGWSYVATDRWDIRGAVDPDAFDSFIDHDADATDLVFAATGGYELFIAQHVIEELPDYPAALDEAARVLEPGGRALLEIPFEAAVPRTVRQPRDRYANVWSFGADLVSELQQRFDRVEPVSVSEGEYAGTVFACRV
jgi:SAM-dependent methyltransferase